MGHALGDAGLIRKCSASAALVGLAEARGRARAAEVVVHYGHNGGRA